MWGQWSLNAGQWRQNRIRDCGWAGVRQDAELFSVSGRSGVIQQCAVRVCPGGIYLVWLKTAVWGSPEWSFGFAKGLSVIGDSDRVDPNI